MHQHWDRKRALCTAHSVEPLLATGQHCEERNQYSLRHKLYSNCPVTNLPCPSPFAAPTSPFSNTQKAHVGHGPEWTRNCAVEKQAFPKVSPRIGTRPDGHGAFLPFTRPLCHDHTSEEPICTRLMKQSHEP